MLFVMYANVKTFSCSSFIILSAVFIFFCFLAGTLSFFVADSPSNIIISLFVLSSLSLHFRFLLFSITGGSDVSSSSSAFSSLIFMSCLLSSSDVSSSSSMFPSLIFMSWLLGFTNCEEIIVT